MPHRSCDDARNVLFNEMVLPYNGYALSEDEMAASRIAALRTAVNGAGDRPCQQDHRQEPGG